MKQIKINGPIVDDSDLSFYEWAGMSAVAPRTVISELEKFKGEDVQVLINSGGGSVFAGSEIYTALKKHKGRVEVIVTGLSASIASIIMLAGDSIKASPISQIMIHNVSTVQKGDYQKMRHVSKTLDLASASLAKMYSQKTGQTEEVIRKMMDEETWFNAYSAKELGLVDEILFDNTLQLVAYHGEIISKDKINE
ncbi:TPA: head maturation protease, ClpP-related, partial [Streptococcus pyogenes]